MGISKEKATHIFYRDREELRAQYKKAVENEQEMFEYKGSPMVTLYAKYVLEFFDTNTNIPKDNDYGI